MSEHVTVQHVLPVIDEKPGVDRQCAGVVEGAGRNAYRVHPHPIEGFIGFVRINLVTHKLERIHMNMVGVYQRVSRLSWKWRTAFRR